jgi:hypothetical protein
MGKSRIAVSALGPLLGVVVTLGLLPAQQADRFADVAARMQEFVGFEPTDLLRAGGDQEENRR